MSTQSSSESSDVRWTSRMVVEFEKTFDPSVGGSNKSVLRGKTVKIIVGSSKTKKFTIASGTLRRQSKYFDRELKSWKPSRGDVLTLATETVDTFRVYAQWLHQNRFKFWRNFDWLLDCYFMGARLQDHDFQDAIIDALIIVLLSNTGDDGLYGKRVNLIYDYTPHGDPARQLVIDSWLRADVEQPYKRLGTNLPGDFCVDLANAVKRLRRGSDASPVLHDGKGNTCMYHRHDEGMCYSKRS